MDKKRIRKSSKAATPVSIKPQVQVSHIHGKPTLLINGKKMEPFEDNGVFVPYSLIKEIGFVELVKFSPIIVTYSEKNYRDPVLKNFFNLNVEPEFIIEVIDEMTVELFVTVMDGFDDELHNEYQLTLEKIVKENPEFTTYGNVHVGFDEMVKMQEDLAKLNKEDGFGISYSPVGFVQFSVNIHGFLFKDIYHHLTKLIAGLDAETNRRMLEKLDE